MCGEKHETRNCHKPMGIHLQSALAAKVAILLTKKGCTMYKPLLQLRNNSDDVPRNKDGNNSRAHSIDTNYPQILGHPDSTRRQSNHISIVLLLMSSH